MKAEELRIGNYVQVNSEIKTVTAIGFDTISTNNTFPLDYHKYSEVEPIILTESQLKRLGFFVSDSIPGMKGGIGLGKRKDYYYLPMHDSMGKETHFLKIKYVHKLQNLFYTLTGEELKYNNVLPPNSQHSTGENNS